MDAKLRAAAAVTWLLFTGLAVAEGGPADRIICGSLVTSIWCFLTWRSNVVSSRTAQQRLLGPAARRGLYDPVVLPVFARKGRLTPARLCGLASKLHLSPEEAHELVQAMVENGTLEPSGPEQASGEMTYRLTEHGRSCMKPPPKEKILIWISLLLGILGIVGGSALVGLAKANPAATALVVMLVLVAGLTSLSIALTMRLRRRARIHLQRLEEMEARLS